jgi:uncharacterized protein YfdQ (DUF2303 family)
MDADAIQKLYDYGAAQVPVPDGVEPFIVVPDGFELKSLVGMQKYPTHIRGTVHVFHADSFLEYWKRFATPASLIFADAQTPALVGILDYHEPAETHEGQEGHEARHSYHRVAFNFRKSAEWKIWEKKNNDYMPQVEFAEFIEDNLDDIIEPASAEMFEMVKNFDAKKSVNFSSAIRLDNGQVQFKYEESISGAPRGGLFTVPDAFKLSIRPYEGSNHYLVNVRFRYRISPQGLQLKYELVRPHKVIEDAVNTIVATVQDALGDKLILSGTASA